MTEYIFVGLIVLSAVGVSVWALADAEKEHCGDEGMVVE